MCDKNTTIYKLYLVFSFKSVYCGVIRMWLYLSQIILFTRILMWIPSQLNIIVEAPDVLRKQY
jgi:hypothetical protein